MADISVIASDSTQSTSSAEIAAEPEDDTPMHSDETEATKDRAGGKLTKTCNLTRLKLLAGLVPIVLYAVDVGSDVSLAVTYFLDGEWIYGGLTTAFCVFAYVTLVVMGVKFFNNYDEEQPRRRVCRLFLVMLGLSPVVASVEYLRCRWKDLTPRRSDKKLLLKADYALMILRLLESFLEAAPQLCLQLYIVFKEKRQEKDVRAVLQIVAVFSSWVSLAMSAAMYRKFDPDDSDEALTTIPWYNRLLWFLWRLCETGGRVLCIALFASTFEYWVFVLLCCHYGIVLICACWAMKDKELGKFKAVAWGYVLLFCVPLPDQDARYVYSFYYVIFYAENFLMLGLWAGMTSDRDAWFYIPGIAVVVVFFFLHVAMQLIFYVFFHPSAESIKWCVKCDRESFCVPVCSRQSDVKQMNSADGISEDEKSSLTGHAPLMEVDDCVNKQKMQTVGSLTNGLYGGRCVGEGERCSEGDEGNTSQRILKEYRYDDIPFMDEDL